MATLSSSRKIAYHVKDGPVEMYTIDANNAVANHPKEWSFKPQGGGNFDEKVGIEVPAGWRDLSTQMRRQIAIRLGEPSTITGSQADEVIAKEEDRRSKLPPETEQPRNPRAEPRNPQQQEAAQAERLRIEQAEKDRLAGEKVNEDKRKQQAEAERKAAADQKAIDDQRRNK